jgi:hypothetical protein
VSHDDHGHDHGHGHDHPHPAEPVLGPSGSGTVVLEVGDGIGALVLLTPPELDGHEIEISPVGGGARTHSMVRPRHTATKTTYAAVYVDVPEGDYIVWHEDGNKAGEVTINGGEANKFYWPS